MFKKQYQDNSDLEIQRIIQQQSIDPEKIYIKDQIKILNEDNMKKGLISYNQNLEYQFEKEAQSEDYEMIIIQEKKNFEVLQNLQAKLIDIRSQIKEKQAFKSVDLDKMKDELVNTFQGKIRNLEYQFNQVKQQEQSFQAIIKKEKDYQKEIQDLNDKMEQKMKANFQLIYDISLFQKKNILKKGCIQQNELQRQQQQASKDQEINLSKTFVSLTEQQKHLVKKYNKLNKNFQKIKNINEKLKKENEIYKLKKNISLSQIGEIKNVVNQKTALFDINKEKLKFLQNKLQQDSEKQEKNIQQTKDQSNYTLSLLNDEYQSKILILDCINELAIKKRKYCELQALAKEIVKQRSKFESQLYREVDFTFDKLDKHIINSFDKSYIDKSYIVNRITSKKSQDEQNEQNKEKRAISIDLENAQKSMNSRLKKNYFQLKYTDQKDILQTILKKIHGQSK